MKIDVLIVDDDEDIRATLTEFLRDEGYIAEETSDAAHLAQLLADGHPRLVLLDLTLPGENPVAVLKKARADGLLHGTLVYALSGLEEMPDIVTQLGLDGGFSKPFDIEELLQTVARVCGAAPAGRSRAVSAEASDAYPPPA